MPLSWGLQLLKRPCLRPLKRASIAPLIAGKCAKTLKLRRIDPRIGLVSPVSISSIVHLQIFPAAASPGRISYFGRGSSNLDCSKPTPWRETLASDRVPRPAAGKARAGTFRIRVGGTFEARRVSARRRSVAPRFGQSALTSGRQMETRRETKGGSCVERQWALHRHHSQEAWGLHCR